MDQKRKSTLLKHFRCDKSHLSNTEELISNPVELRFIVAEISRTNNLYQKSCPN